MKKIRINSEIVWGFILVVSLIIVLSSLSLFVMTEPIASKSKDMVIRVQGEIIEKKSKDNLTEYVVQYTKGKMLYETTFTSYNSKLENPLLVLNEKDEVIALGKNIDIGKNLNEVSKYLFLLSFMILLFSILVLFITSKIKEGSLNRDVKKVKTVS